MSNLTIQLDPVALREATAQAIMGLLTPELREKILRESVCQLLNPISDHFGRRTSPLQEAFDNAIRKIANEAALEVVKNDTAIAERIKALVADAAQRAMAVTPEKLAEKMAEAFIFSCRRE